MAESGESRAYPQRLHHAVPGWVKTGSYFHIRIRVACGNMDTLTQPLVARMALSAVGNYHQRGRWYALLFLIMPDHTHAILAFPYEVRMGRVIGEWKHYMEKAARIDWQANFFDHRIRDSAGLKEKYAYILRNPVVKGLCKREEDWPWVWTPPEGE
jgi:putative transposase